MDYSKHSSANKPEQLEKFRSQILSRNDHARSPRTAISELAKQLASANQAIAWITWIAKFTPSALTRDTFIEYDRELRVVLSEIVTARISVAALDETAHLEIGEVIKRLYDLDATLGRIKAEHMEDEMRRTRLAEFCDEALKFDEELRQTATAVLRSFDDRCHSEN